MWWVVCRGSYVVARLSCTRTSCTRISYILGRGLVYRVYSTSHLVCHISYVASRMSHLECRISSVTSRMSHFVCHFSFVVICMSKLVCYIQYIIPRTYISYIISHMSYRVRYISDVVSRTSYLVRRNSYVVSYIVSYVVSYIVLYTVLFYISYTVFSTSYLAQCIWCHIQYSAFVPHVSLMSLMVNLFRPCCHYIVVFFVSGVIVSLQVVSPYLGQYRRVWVVVSPSLHHRHVYAKLYIHYCSYYLFFRL